MSNPDQASPDPPPTITIELFLDPLNQPEYPWPAIPDPGVAFADTHLLDDGSAGLCAIKITDPSLADPAALAALLPHISRHLILDTHKAREQR